ncbi:CMRF35-like molecule 1 isoform X2 [Nelusetta ayraudi]
MAVALYILFLMSGLQGIYSISTVSLLSVKAGRSVSIPCLYQSTYTNYVKYLCKGFIWNSCTYEIRTDQRNSARYSISDDKKQRIFTVTINDVTNQADAYWCIVERHNAVDDGVQFQLQVTSGTPGFTVTNQQIEGFYGERTSINCFYQHFGENNWCKLGGVCVRGSEGWIDGSKVTINNSGLNFFTVTMSGLTFQHTGWYYCARGNLQMPVHLTVTEKPTTTSFYSFVGSTQKTSTSVVTSGGSTQKPSTAGETTQSS